jgi:hypothetical protein
LGWTSWAISLVSNNCPFKQFVVLTPSPVLAIPVIVVWRVKASLAQKTVLLVSLCLTVCVVALNVVKLAGLRYKNQVDFIWGAHWQLLAAEVGVLLSAAISFRSFFVHRAAKRADQNVAFTKERRFFTESFLRRFHGQCEEDSLGDSLPGEGRHTHGLPGVPRAHMTGTRSFIDEQGRSHTVPDLNNSNFGLREAATWEKGEEDQIPLKPYPSET